MRPAFPIGKFLVLAAANDAAVGRRAEIEVRVRRLPDQRGEAGVDTKAGHVAIEPQHDYGDDVFARVELYAPGEHLIAFADSKPFRVLTEHELAHLPQTCVPTG